MKRETSSCTTSVSGRASGLGYADEREAAPEFARRVVRELESLLTEVLPGTALEKDWVVPATPMTVASSGAEVSMSDFRQRFSVAVCFLHDGCEPCAGYARKLADLEGELREVDARAVVVLSESGVLDLPVWIDVRGRARQRFLGLGAELPVLLVVDRYGAGVRSFPSASHAFPLPEEVVATLRHLAFQCPECGVSEW
jgi:hypothetical protein